MCRDARLHTGARSVLAAEAPGPGAAHWPAERHRPPRACSPSSGASCPCGRQSWRMGFTLRASSGLCLQAEPHGGGGGGGGTRAVGFSGPSSLCRPHPPIPPTPRPVPPVLSLCCEVGWDGGARGGPRAQGGDVARSRSGPSAWLPCHGPRGTVLPPLAPLLTLVTRCLESAGLSQIWGVFSQEGVECFSALPRPRGAEC